MVAEGTYSNPQDAYFDAQDNQAPRLNMLPLDWDQTHTLNFRTTFGKKDWVISSIGKLWSGKPYTPEFKTGVVSGAGSFSGFADNSERKPNTFTVDLRASYKVSFLGLKSNLYCNIELDVQIISEERYRRERERERRERAGGDSSAARTNWGLPRHRTPKRPQHQTDTARPGTHGGLSHA